MPYHLRNHLGIYVTAFLFLLLLTGCNAIRVDRGQYDGQMSRVRIAANRRSFLLLNDYKESFLFIIKRADRADSDQVAAAFVSHSAGVSNAVELPPAKYLVVVTTPVINESYWRVINLKAGDDVLCRLDMHMMELHKSIFH